MQNTGRYRNFDRRMTGASVIDEALQEVSSTSLFIFIQNFTNGESFVIVSRIHKWKNCIL